ncbi:hypothetical protein ACNHUS_07805 [Actinomycetes bacterium M1A6_2h]
MLGPWANRRRLNVAAVLIVSVLLLLSGILMATTLFPDVNVVALSEQLVVGSLAVTAVMVTVGLIRGSRSTRPSPPTVTLGGKVEWRMPPLGELEPMSWSLTAKLGMLALRGYLVAGAVLLVVKAVEMAPST